MIRRIIAALVLSACSIALPLSAAERFDGHWQGRATLSAGAPGCPIMFNFRVLFSGDKFAGIGLSGGNEFEITGELAGAEKIEGLLFNSTGLATFVATFRDGKWQGGWDAEGECDGAWSMERVK